MANAIFIYKEYRKISYRNQIVLALIFFHKHQNEINDYLYKRHKEKLTSNQIYAYLPNCFSPLLRVT